MEKHFKDETHFELNNLNTNAKTEILWEKYKMNQFGKPAWN